MSIGTIGKTERWIQWKFSIGDAECRYMIPQINVINLLDFEMNIIVLIKHWRVECGWLTNMATKANQVLEYRTRFSQTVVIASRLCFCERGPGRPREFKSK